MIENKNNYFRPYDAEKYFVIIGIVKIKIIICNKGVPVNTLIFLYFWIKKKVMI